MKTAKVEKSKRPALRRKQIRDGSLMIRSVAVVLLLQVLLQQLTGKLSDQKTADRWNPDGGSGQVSCFFTEDVSIPESRIAEFRYYIEKGLTEASMEKPEEEDRRLFADCYSATGYMTIRNEADKSLKVSAIGVGGDFFLFHPMPLLSGSYFDEDDLMQDLVVIDEDTAWAMFGSNQVAGMELYLGGVPHKIAGVVSKERDRLSQAAGLGNKILYCSYASLSRYGVIDSAGLYSAEQTGNTAGNASGTATGNATGTATGAASGTGNENSDTQTGGISCYEVVLPSPVRGFAAQLLRSKIAVAETQMQVVDNTWRFTPEHLLPVITSFGTRSMQMLPVHYPWWENVARGVEDLAALILLLQILFAVLAFLLTCVICVRAYRNRRWTTEGLVRGLGDRIYDVQAQMKATHDKWRYF